MLAEVTSNSGNTSGTFSVLNSLSAHCSTQASIFYSTFGRLHVSQPQSCCLHQALPLVAWQVMQHVETWCIRLPQQIRHLPLLTIRAEQCISAVGNQRFSNLQTAAGELKRRITVQGVAQVLNTWNLACQALAACFKAAAEA